MSEGSHAERAAAGGEPRRRGPPQEVSAPEGTAAGGEPHQTGLLPEGAAEGMM
jgi:hypothetical protein